MCTALKYLQFPAECLFEFLLENEHQAGNFNRRDRSRCSLKVGLAQVRIDLASRWAKCAPVNDVYLLHFVCIWLVCVRRRRALFRNKNREVSSTAARIKEKRRVCVYVWRRHLRREPWLPSPPTRVHLHPAHRNFILYIHNPRTPPRAPQNRKQKSKRRHEFRKLCRKLMFLLSQLWFL